MLVRQAVQPQVPGRTKIACQFCANSWRRLFSLHVVPQATCPAVEMLLLKALVYEPKEPRG